MADRDIVPQPQRGISTGDKHDLVSRGLRHAETLARSRPSGHQIRITEGGVLDFGVSPDGSFVVAGLHGGGLLAWDAESGRRTLALSKCRDVEEEGWGFTFDAEREAVTFWTSFDGVQRAQVNVRTGVMSDAPPDQGRRALWELAKTTAQAFGLWPYRSNFIPETYLGAIDRFYDLETSLLHLYGLHPSPAHEEIDLCPDLADKYLSRKFSPDGRYVFCHAWELRGKDLFLDASYLWDLRSRTMVTRLNHRESRLGQTGRRFGGAKVDGWFSPDSRALITAGDREDGLSVWEVEHGRRVRTLPTEAIPAAFSADSRRLVLVAAHHMMEVWDVASGAMCQSLGPNPGPFNVVKASADARTVAGWSFGIDTELAASWGVEPRHEWFSIWTAPSRRDQ